MSNNRKIVGHKTFRDGPLGFRHEPLYEDEAQALMAACDAADKKRAEDMPDEKAAVAAMFEAWLRLKELGWREAEYCPKDGTPFLAAIRETSAKATPGTWRIDYNPDESPNLWIVDSLATSLCRSSGISMP